MSRNTNDTVAASNNWLGDLDKFYSFIIYVQTYEDTIQEFTSMGNLHQSSVGVWVLVLLAIRTNCLLLYWRVCGLAYRSILVCKWSDWCQKLFECGNHVFPQVILGISFLVSLKDSKFTSAFSLFFLQMLKEQWARRRGYRIWWSEQNKLRARVVWFPKLFPSSVGYFLGLKFL